MDGPFTWASKLPPISVLLDIQILGLGAYMDDEEWKRNLFHTIRERLAYNFRHRGMHQADKIPFGTKTDLRKE
jgi:hypothetical protein